MVRGLEAKVARVGRGAHARNGRLEHGLRRRRRSVQAATTKAATAQAATAAGANIRDMENLHPRNARLWSDGSHDNSGVGFAHTYRRGSAASIHLGGVS